VASRSTVVAALLPTSLLVYAAVAVAYRWWPSAVMAPLVALLLWRRHRRARFTAYVFFSVLAVRGALTGVWALPAYALVAVGLLQTPAARGAWPRLRPGRVRAPADDLEPDDRMRPT
jgi:hypothetical protein